MWKHKEEDQDEKREHFIIVDRKQIHLQTGLAAASSKDNIKCQKHISAILTQ